MGRGILPGVILLAAVFLAIPAAFYAQNPFLAPTGAMDTLNSGSVTGGLNAAVPLDRARAAANAANTAGFPGAPPPAAAAPAPAPLTMGAGPAPIRTPTAGGYAGGYTGGGYGAAPGAAATPGTPTPTPIPLVKVLTGERVIDHVTRQLLSDIRYEDVPQNELSGKYFDDGTHGDEKAGDLLYTNISERDDVIGPDTHQVLSKLVTALERAEDLSPLEFFHLRVLTTETISEIDKLRAEETARDQKLREWVVQFVREYKTNPDDAGSEFWPLYVVPAPPTPSRKVARPVDTWTAPTSLVNMPSTSGGAAQAEQGEYGGGEGYGGGGGY